jgi:hypothetical protein
VLRASGLAGRLAGQPREFLALGRVRHSSFRSATHEALPSTLKTLITTHLLVFRVSLMNNPGQGHRPSALRFESLVQPETESSWPLRQLVVMHRSDGGKGDPAD